MSFSIIAPAKLNLTLHITGKQKNGLHLLDSIVAFADYGDRLEFQKADDSSVTLAGPFASDVDGSPFDNLVFKALQAFKAHTGINEGVHIHLHKSLPVGAGIGGGSADAAATLLGLCRFWNIKPEGDELHTIAKGLGSDVPVCLHQGVVHMKDVGDHITHIADHISAWVVLVNPMVKLLTGDVFKALSVSSYTKAASFSSIEGFSELVDILNKSGNDLEMAAINLQPVIADILNVLRADNSCCIARMSGSGATCFGLYGNADDAKIAAERIQNINNNWWVVPTALRGK